MTSIWAAFILAVHMQTDTSNAVVPMSAEPFHWSVLENRDVAVYDVRLPVGALMRFHAHPTNHLAIVIEPGVLRNEVLGREGREHHTGPAGNIVYLGAGPAHRQANADRTEIRFIAVELLRPMRREGQGNTPGMTEGIMGQEQRVAPDGAAGCRVAIDAADVRVWRCRVEPGQSAARESAGPFLRIAVTAGVAESSNASDSARRERLKAGAVAWHTSAAAAPVKNAGEAPLELVDIEYK